MHGAIVRTDATVTFLSERPEGIQHINDAVGGWFDAVGVDHASIYVHDEGLLIGLPINLIASAIAGQPLVGDAFITGPLDRGTGETLDLSPRIEQLLRRDLVEVAMA